MIGAKKGKLTDYSRMFGIKRCWPEHSDWEFYIQESEEDETLPGMGCTWIMQPGEGSETPVHSEKHLFREEHFWLLPVCSVRNCFKIPTTSLCCGANQYKSLLLLVLGAGMNPKARSFYSWWERLKTSRQQCPVCCLSLQLRHRTSSKTSESTPKP